MPFPVDAAVVVKSIGKTGRVVEAARNGRYRVRVGAIVLACGEADLEAAATDSRKGKRGKSKHAPSPAVERGSGASAVGNAGRVPQSLDLHGFTVQEAIAKVEERIDLALRAGLDSIDIIHGRGSGRVKVAVHRLLGELTAVRHFELARDNPGVTRVFF